MSEYLSPTSPERYLHDTLYNLQSLRELSMKSTELAIADDQLLEDCSVFKDLKTGNRIIVSALPDDESEFVGASVVVTAIDGIDVGYVDSRLSQPELVFHVTSDYQVYVRDSEEQWLAFPAQELAHLLDVPQTKPVAVSENDPRDTPPIIKGTIPEEASPKELNDYYAGQLSSDFLAMPKDGLYTHCSALFDALLQDEHAYQETISLEGLIKTFKSQLFKLDITEVPSEETIDGYVGFDRTFMISYSVLNGPTAMGAMRLGQQAEVLLVKGNSFDFKLKRHGLVMYAHENDRRINLVPVDHTILTLYLAAIAGE